MHVLGFDPHAFAHFRDERKRRRIRVSCVMMFSNTHDQLLDAFTWHINLHILYSNKVVIHDDSDI